MATTFPPTKIGPPEFPELIDKLKSKKSSATPFPQPATLPRLW